MQEESINQGAFQYAKMHVDRMLEHLDFEEQEMDVIGRKSMHSFCTGAVVENQRQVKELWNEFNLRCN